MTVNVDVILKFLISVTLTLNVSIEIKFTHQRISFSVSISGATSNTTQADSHYAKIVFSFATTGNCWSERFKKKIRKKSLFLQYYP